MASGTSQTATGTEEELPSWTLSYASCINAIPVGRQLPRTPPPRVTQCLRFETEDAEPVLSTSNAEVDGDVEVFSRRSLRIENPLSMLKGMKDYRLTPDDLMFLQKKAQEEDLRKLQEKLAETQALLKTEVKALKLAEANKELVLARCDQLPSCDQLSTWAKMVLGEDSDLDTKSLLATVPLKKIQRLINQKKKGIARMEAAAAERRQKEDEERGNLEQQVATEAVTIQELMRQLTDLKMDLAQQEEQKSKGPELEKLPAARGRGRTRKEVKPRENAGETTRKIRPTRTDGEMKPNRGRLETWKESEPVKTRGRRQRAARPEPPPQQQPGPELRRSKRIASRT